MKRRHKIRDGLLLILIGMGLQVIAQGISFFSGPGNMLWAVNKIVSLIAYLTLLVGLFKLSKVNARYKRARTLEIIAFVLFLAANLLTVNREHSAAFDESETGYAVLVLIELGVIIVLFVLNMFVIHGILIGNAEFAAEERDGRMAKKFRGIWARYCLSAAGAIVTSIVFLVGFAGRIYQMVSDGSFVGGVEIAELSVLALLIMFVLLYIVCVVQIQSTTHALYLKFKKR